MSTEKVTVIYQNIDDLVMVSGRILESLGDSKNIGKKFLDIIDSLYPLQIYCVGHSKAMECLQAETRQNKQFRKLLQELQYRPDCEGLQLASFLLEPVQRLARYPLLLRQIFHHTTKDDDEHAGLAEAISKAESFVRQTDEAVRSAENLEWLLSFNRKIHASNSTPYILKWILSRSRHENSLPVDLTGMTKKGQPRQFVFSGQVSIEGRKVEMVLLSDMILFFRDDKLENDPVEIEALKFSGLEDERKFMINDMQVKASDRNMKDCWLHELKKTQESYVSLNEHKLTVPKLVQFIGSVIIEVYLESWQPIKCTEFKILFSLGFQQAKTKTIDSKRWNEKVILAVPDLSHELIVSVLSEAPFQLTRETASVKLNLDFLEYYENKHTDRMSFNLKPANMTISMQIYYKTF